MDYQLVTRLIEDLTDLSRNKNLALSENSLRSQLSCLTNKERMLLEKSFYKHSWDIKSACVLRLLCEMDLFSLPIYLTKLERPEEQQNILNDLLETEYFLLADLVRTSMIGSPIGTKVRDILTEGIKSLLLDLLSNPEVLVPNYLNELRRHHLNDDQMRHILDIHLTSMLKLDSCPSAREAIRRQNLWDKENFLKINLSLMNLAAEICLDCEQILSKLIGVMMGPKFTGWKFALALFKFLLWSAPELKSSIKRHSSELFTEWIGRRSEFHFNVMFLLARQLSYAAGTSKCETYQQWYKFEIGDMNYKFKSKDDFQYALKMLTSLVPDEFDPDFRTIQLNTAIPAPPYCKVFVTAYKEALKRRDSECLSSKSPDTIQLDREDCVIIID